MTAFEPGEGWVQAAAESRSVEEGSDVIIRVHNGVRTYWVREEPVPALPTWTVIRYPSRGIDDEPSVHINTPAGWALVQGKSLQFNARGWQPRDGFEVLAEPASEHNYTEDAVRRIKDELRRETAKAVLDRVMVTGISGAAVDALYREFGVES